MAPNATFFFVDALYTCPSERGLVMRLYLIPVMGFCFCVDALLLVGAGRLGGGAVDGRCALASALGALYGGVCMLPGMAAWGALWVRLGVLAVMGIVAFGIQKDGLRRTALFAVLNMAAVGLAGGVGGGWLQLLLAAVLILLLCAFTLKGWDGKETVPVIIPYRGREMRVTALRDTGNRLCDPVTGEPVLVVGAQVAQRLLMLSPQQLRDPVMTMSERPLPGLRLIPYRTVGRDGGLLLALRMENVQIGKRCKDMLVAFAPEGLGEDRGFQALTGGVV